MINKSTAKRNKSNGDAKVHYIQSTIRRRVPLSSENYQVLQKSRNKTHQINIRRFQVHTKHM